jgi:hypothetical protein
MEGLAYWMQHLKQLIQLHSMRLEGRRFNFEAHHLIPATFLIQTLTIPSQHRFWLAPLFAYFHSLDASPSSFDD